MVKAAVRSLVLAVMLVLLGTGLQFCGTAVNRLVMEHNEGRMPVWMINRSVALAVLLSPENCPLTRETRYPLLADIIPQPITTADNPQVHLARSGQQRQSLGTPDGLRCHSHAER